MTLSPASTKFTKQHSIPAEPGAETAMVNTTPSSYSDPFGQTERILVFIALYDPDSVLGPFSLVDADNDNDGNLYTGDTSNLLWLSVALENGAQPLTRPKSLTNLLPKVSLLAFVSDLLNFLILYEV